MNALELHNISKSFALRKGGLFAGTTTYMALRNVSLTVPKNRIVGLVGESGSGKTTTGMIALRLTEPTSGRIIVDGTDITTLSPSMLKPIRAKMQVVFQDSYSALDPMMTLAQVVAEPLHIHGVGEHSSQTTSALDWLERVGLHRSYGNRYPHELSGGQRQRVAIARALILRPDILIADEPTSALDVTVQIEILRILDRLVTDRGMGLIFISHDLRLVSSFCDRVLVMYAGRVVEELKASELAQAKHPYTQGLFKCLPKIEGGQRPLPTLQRDAEWAR